MARSEEPAKLKVTFTPGWAASNCVPSAVKVFFSEAAAKTVRVPPPDAEVVALVGVLSDDDEQAVAASRVRAAQTTRRRFTRLLEAFR
ncbi:hypothetical protein GCM10009810_32920 [Nostocoides vanveenii]|uniref:Uncharacterized protein n=1 Tax=Nostocoides vanveenii TaxID=330835 RepID=A0ABP4X8D7_9MICO